MLLDCRVEHIHYLFSPDLPPVIEIESGKSITVETRDASNGQMRPERQAVIDRSILLPVTGPISIVGAQPGDAVAIRIDHIDFAATGYAWLRNGLGVRAMSLDGPYYLKEFKVQGDRAVCDQFSVPMRPMVGIVGVAPREPTATRLPGRHGGNLDCNAIAPGSTVWLPVNVPGALISMGDAHAAMGDGEVSGTGVEIEASVRVTLTLHPARTLDGPVVVCPDKTLFLASAPTLEQAISGALERTIEALMEHCHLSQHDAYILASTAGAVKVCQVVNGESTAAFELPAQVLAW